MDAKKLIALLLALLIGTGACTKRSTANETPGTTELATAPSPEQYHQAQGGVAPAVPAKFFRGSIGNTLGLQMRLQRDGAQLAGNYFYQKVGTRIDVKGTIDKDNNVTLEEIDPGGKQTGLFKGSWTLDKDDGLASIAGNWSKPNGEKKTAFSLHEEPIEFTGGVALTAKQLKESNKKLNYKIEAAYPQATGAPDNRFDKFNQEAKNRVTKRISDFKKELADVAKDEATSPSTSPEDKSSFPTNSLDITYSIALAKDDLISIEFDVDSYSSGAAHPNSSSAVLNYDVKTGKALKLADLFNPGAKYIQSISAYCIKDLKSQSKSKDSMLDDQTIQSGAGPDAQNYDSWTITKKGLKIIFDPYQVAAYAAGPQSVVVPYSALKDLIKPDGPLAQFVK
jgi:hypothetical protein